MYPLGFLQHFLYTNNCKFKCWFLGESYKMEMEMTYYNTLFRPVPRWCIIVPYCILYSVLSSVFLNILNVSIISLREKSPFSKSSLYQEFLTFQAKFSHFHSIASLAIPVHRDWLIDIVLFFSWSLILWKCIILFSTLKGILIKTNVFHSFDLWCKWICPTQTHFIAPIWNSLQVFGIDTSIISFETSGF